MFTSEEEEIYNHLVDAHNLFVSLETKHPLDQKDFSDLIRHAQNILLSRVACRELGWTYTDGGMRIESHH